MTDPVLRDKILAAFFQGPDAAVEIIREMLDEAFLEGQRGGGVSPYRSPPVLDLTPSRRGKVVNLKVMDDSTVRDIGPFMYTPPGDDAAVGSFVPLEESIGEDGPAQ